MGASREAALEIEIYKEIQTILNQGKRRGAFILKGNGRPSFSDLHLLTAKPIFYIANVDQRELRGEGVCLKALRDWVEKEGHRMVIICGDLEAEIAELNEGEREEFRRELGLEGSSLDRLIQVGYEILNLITFYTTVSSELRAWTVPKGTPAPKAAGKIHKDMERGFIRAEVLPFPIS